MNNFLENFKISYQWKKYIIAILVFLIAYCGYLKTLSPTVSFEDSGEFITISYVLGDAHPPGYQFYTLIGKISTLFPISSIAFRVINLSAYCGAGSAVLLFFVILLILENSKSKTSLIGAATASIIFAFSSVLWDLSIIDEVYGMSCLITLLQIFLLLKWEKALKDTPYTNLREKYSLPRMGYLYMFALFYGLIFGVHHTAVLFVIVFFYFILSNDYKSLGLHLLIPVALLLYVFYLPEEYKSVGMFILIALGIIYLYYVFTNELMSLTFRNCAVLVFMWSIGFLSVFYLPVRSTRNPIIDWGDPQTLQGFLDVFLRRQYGGVSGFISSFPDFIKKIPFFDLIDQFSPYMIIFILLGAFRLFKLSLKHFIFISCIFISYSIGFLIIIDPPVPYELPLLLQTFYIPIHMILAIWMGIGFTYIMEIGINLSKNITSYQARKIILISLIFILALLPMTPYKWGFPSHNNAKHFVAYDYGMNMLRSVERNGVIFTFLAQDTFPLWYLTHVEGRRKDVVVVHQRLLSLPWHSKQVRNNNPGFIVDYPVLEGYEQYNLFKIADLATQSIIVKNPERPIYFSNFRTPNETQKFPLKETGLIGKLSNNPKPERIVGRDVFNYYVYRQLFHDGEVTKDNRTRELSSIYVYAHEYEAGAYIDYRYSVFIAVSLLKQALLIEPTNPYLYRNLAQSYLIVGAKSAAIDLFERSLTYDKNSEDAQITRNIINQLKVGQ